METPAGVEVEEVQETDKEEEADIGIVKTEDDDEEDDDEEEDDEDDDDEEDDEKKCRVDMELIRDGLTPGAEGEVPIVPYLSAYIEIYKFIKLMGPLFYFLAYDVKLKINILKKELAGENRQHYVDVRTMIAYEKNNNLLFRPDCLSGTNALLQLHRLLEFLPDFMKELVKDDEEEPVLGQVASELYLATLARFHPSILSRILSGVMYLLPSRATFQNKVTRGNEEAEELHRRVMPDAIWSVTQTYEACQALYRDHDFTLLPSQHTYMGPM